MNEKTKRQMYVVTASCWKCKKAMNVAVIEENESTCGPERFTAEEIVIAATHDVVIKKQYSYTREEAYCANTCPHCNTFIGQHYLFSNYFAPALYGDYKCKIIELKSNHMDFNLKINT